jgi:inhibitor of KinA
VNDGTPTIIPEVIPVADHAVLFVFDDEINAATIARIHAVDAALSHHQPIGMTEIVPALTNMLVVFDPLVTDHSEIAAAVLANLSAPSRATAGVNHLIDVCYDGDHAPDLRAVADLSGLDEATVVETHLSGTYAVGMYGFAPGYAYLYGTPAAIQLPRNPTPGPLIAAGSVLIAGQQCLITPNAMATGWFTIGCSPVPMLTGNSARPFLFDVGDAVTFRRIDAQELRRRLDEQSTAAR